MDIVNNFKTYLFSQANPPSKITIKNYLSDIRRFITWYENKFSTLFLPESLSPQIIAEYTSSITTNYQSSQPSARSSKRYISSLRKFITFLEETGKIKSNPFALLNQPEKPVDPFFIKEYKNFLYTEQASKLTIKNYLADVYQFLRWLAEVTNKDIETDSGTLLTDIDNPVLEEYKTRLFHVAQLSPVSINRKLSSLRRYTRWLSQKGVLTYAVVDADFDKAPVTEQQIEQSSPEETILSQPEIPLTVLQDLVQEKEEKKMPHYSRFGPFRLFQKTSNIINLGTDLLFFSPIAHGAEIIHYSLWKKGKKQIFAPVTSILEASSYIPKGVSIKTIIPKQISIIPPRSANIASVLEKVSQFGINTNPETVHNFTKALYAPLDISTKHMHWKDKLWHYLRYKRPQWYLTYHDYSFVTYLHFGVMIIAMVIAGSAIYQTWNGPGSSQSQAVLSAQSIAPPRTLSFQGKLLDSTNTPITAETPLRFALYSSPTASGAALLWQENQYITPDHNGNFSTRLGEKTPLDQSIFTNNPSLYVGITVGDNQELSPRQQIATTGLAENSQSVEGLKPITDSPTLSQNVLLALDSAGNLTIGGNASHTFQATGGQFNLSGQTMLLTTNSGSNGNITIAPDGSGIIDLQKPIQNTSNYTTPGGVPGAVEVADILSVLATSSSQSALVVNQNGSGDIISGQSNGIDKFRLDAKGDAFLGGDIILNGDTINTTSTTFDIGGATVQNLSIGTGATQISLGSTTGQTVVNNNLSVHGDTSFTGAVETDSLLKANAGIFIPDGQHLHLDYFPTGAIPFISVNSDLMQNANNFSWDNDNSTLKVLGSLCVNSVSDGVCNSDPGTITVKNSLNVDASADLAEDYVSSQNLEPGDVVVLEGQNDSDAIIKSTSPYQTQLLGIVSTNPGVTLNSGAQTDSQHPNVYPLALQGRVPIKISSINGSIQAGDDLTSSSIPGVAMKATGGGQIIGKALEGYTNSDPNAVGKIMAFVNLTYRTNPATITDNGSLAAASQSGDLIQSISNQIANNPSLLQTLNTIIQTIGLGATQAQTITSQSVQNATDTISLGGQTLSDYITTVVTQAINQKLTNELGKSATNPPIINPIASESAQTTNQTASSSATPTQIASSSADIQFTTSEAATDSALTSPIYNSIASSSAEASAAGILTSTASDSADTIDNGTQTIQPNVTPLPGELDSQSNSNNQYESVSSFSGQLTYIPNFKSDFGTFNQGLIALGPTSMTDVSISNTITLNNNLRITSNTIDTIASDLNIQPLKQGNILFMGGLVAIDTQGNLQVNGNANFAQNVNVHGQLAAGIIAPIPNQDLYISLPNKQDKSGSSLVIKNATGSGVLTINQSGDVTSSGDAQFNSVASNGFSIIRGAEADTSMTQTNANSSAGKGVITAYETERTIYTPYVTDHSLIYITPTSSIGNDTPYLARQTAQNPSNGTQGSFTVEIPQSTTQDIGFNWWIVN